MSDNSKPINLIDSLLIPNEPFPAEYLHIFSDITEADLNEIRKIWPRVPVLRKVNLLQDLEGMLESDTLLSCDDFARFALTDEDPEVRSHAIKLLWESSDPKLARTFGELLSGDSSEDVRAEAATALGNFVLLGELEEISPRIFEHTLTLLLQHYNSDLPDRIRQEILRSLSYCGRDEIVAMIKEAYARDKKAWKLAALESMGRSADSRWKNQVLESMLSADADFQYEAIRAAGELELKAARPALLKLLAEEVGNNDVYYQTIWALSKIGGESVKESLQDLLDHAQNDEEVEVLEMALDNLDFNDENSELELF